MKEIKIIIGKGGRTKILAGGASGTGTSEFTKKLADELGDIEERHKGETYLKNEQSQKGQVDQGS